MKAAAKFKTIFSNKNPEYLPRTLWKHHPTEESCEKFVKATLEFNALQNFDIIKITPNSSFCIQGYGCLIEAYGSIFGNVIYRPAFNDIKDWSKLTRLDPTKGTLGVQVESTKKIYEKIGVSQLVFQTIFSPLAQAINLIGLVPLLHYTNASPSHVWDVIEILAATTKNYIQAIAPYVDGFCYAIQESPHLTRFPQTFMDLYHKTNIELLEANPSLIKMMHLHGSVHEFSRFCRYPLDILHWDEEASGISLKSGKALFPGVVSGGISWPDGGWKSCDELARACHATRMRVGTERFLLAPACVIPYQTPPTLIEAFGCR
jgi:uroporphyrinogen decarboxylase